MTAGGRRLDDEAVDVAVGAARQGECQHVGCDDGEKQRPRQRRQLNTRELARVERQHDGIARAGAGRGQWIGGRLVVHETVEHAGDLQRDARAHQHVAHPGEHGAVDRRQVRDLDLFQVVDAHRIRVALAREEDLDEVGHHAERLPISRGGGRRHRRGEERLVRRLASGDVVVIPHLCGQPRYREVVERPAHVPARVTHLQTPRQDLIESGSAHDAELPKSRDTAGQAPVGNAHAHAALDDHHRSMVGPQPGTEVQLFCKSLRRRQGCRRALDAPRDGKLARSG